MMEYTVSIFKDESRIDEIRNLFATSLGETTAEYWKWRLFANNGIETSVAYIATDEEGHIVGMMSLLNMVYGSGKLKGIQNCDWVVDQNHRGQGLISKMYHQAMAHFAEEKYDFSCAFAPNDKSFPIFMKFGFFDDGCSEEWHSPQRVSFGNQKPRNDTTAGYRFEFSEQCMLRDIPIREDRLFRSPEFMRWKFDQNPETKFSWLTISKDNKQIGYFVYTLTRGRFRTAVNVYDWEMFSGDAYAMKRAIHLLHKLGHYVSIWGRYSEREHALLRHAGMNMEQSSRKIVMKALHGTDYPKNLVFTRIDMDY